MKTDANGNIEWEKTFGGSEQDLAYAIIQTSDGGYAVAGLTGSFNGDVIYRPGISDYSFWVIKLSPAGSLLWSKTYGGAAQDIANSIIETTDGGLAIAGSSYSNSGDVLDHKGRYTGNAWMVKTNSNGDIQWSKSYGGVGIVAVYKIVQTSDGGFALAGIADRNGGDITGLHERGDYYYDYLLIRTDPSGTLLWS